MGRHQRFRSLVEINQLITVVNEFLDHKEPWQLYYRLSSRRAAGSSLIPSRYRQRARRVAPLAARF